MLLDNGRTACPRRRDRPPGTALHPLFRLPQRLPGVQRAGGHAYGSVYPGPIGAILTPQLRGLDPAPTLPWASSLCGACYEVCPVKIDIPSVLLHLRGLVVREQKPRLDPEGAAMDSSAWRSPAAGDTSGPAARASRARSARQAWKRWTPARWTEMRDLPEVPAQSFRDWWRSRPPRSAGGDGPAP